MISRNDAFGPAMTYQDLYDNSPDMHCSVEMDTGTIVQCNRTLTDYLGYKKEELLGLPVMELYAPGSRSKAKSAFNQFTRLGIVRNDDLQVMKKDGSKLDVGLSISAFRDEDGRILYSRSTLRDISMTKKLERELRESEEKYRDTFESAYDVIFLLSRNGDILDINHRGEILTGYKRDELRSKNVLTDLIVPEDRATVRNVLSDVSKGMERVYEVRWLTKDGRVIHFEGTTTSRFSPEGDFVSTRCILRDITERREAEQRRRESELRYRVLVETIQEGIMLLDKDQRIRFINKPLCQLIGCSEKELLGTNLWNLRFLDRAKAKTLREMFDSQSTNEKVSQELEFRNNRGERRWLMTSMAPVREEGINSNGSLVVFVDITRLKSVEEELRSHSKQLAKYAFITSHKLRAPVATMRGLINLIDMRNPGEGIDPKIFEKIRDVSMDMDRVIHEAKETLNEDNLLNQDTIRK